MATSYSSFSEALDGLERLGYNRNSALKAMEQAYREIKEDVKGRTTSLKVNSNLVIAYALSYLR